MTTDRKLEKHLYAGIIVCCLTAGAAFAHHGWSSYDDAKELNVTGVIKSSTYDNPHGTLNLTVAGDKPKTWKTILAPPSRMTDRGLSADMLTEGTTATVVGYPHKEHGDEMRMERIIVGGKTVELR